MATPSEREWLEGDYADAEADDYVRAIAEEEANPTVMLPPEPIEIPTDVDLSETAALKPEMFDQAEPRKSNVYSVRLSEDLVGQALDWGRTHDFNGISETIRGALGQVIG